MASAILAAGAETAVKEAPRGKIGQRPAVVGHVVGLAAHGTSQSRPSQARSSKAAASYSGRQRVRSMSSMRRMKRPPASRAASRAVRAEKA